MDKDIAIKALKVGVIILIDIGFGIQEPTVTTFTTMNPSNHQKPIEPPR